MWGCGELFPYWTEELLLLADQELLPGNVFKHSSYSTEELLPSSEINLRGDCETHYMVEFDQIQNTPPLIKGLCFSATW